MPPYDVLVVDLDGTLLSRAGTVSPRNRAAVDRARDAGMIVIVATGRSLAESTEALAAIGHEGVVIAAGGSLVCRAADGATIRRETMPHDVVAEAVEIVQRHGHRALVLKDAHATGYDYLVVGTGRIDAATEWWFRTLPVVVRFADHLDDDPHPHETVRAGAVASSTELTPLADELRGVLGRRAFLQHWPAVTETPEAFTHLLEVFNPDVNKWTALEAWCGENDVDTARVMAIGDGLNDVELIGNAGLGVAMGNADPRVAEAATRQTVDHDEDGVAVAVERVLEGTWS